MYNNLSVFQIFNKESLASRANAIKTIQFEKPKVLSLDVYMVNVDYDLWSFIGLTIFPQ
jgi:hypothetical protein